MTESHFRSHWERVGSARGARAASASASMNCRGGGGVGHRPRVQAESAGAKATVAHCNALSGRGDKRCARPRKNGVRALALASCVSFRSCEGAWDGTGADGAEGTESGKKERVHICCPDMFFCEEFMAKIRLNREHERQKWIFDLIAGRVSVKETVFLDDPDWLLVEGNSYSGQLRRYLVIFKDLTLHTIRDLRQRHVPMLRGVQRKVRDFLAPRHGPDEAFRLYFHYLPSVFQLHLHVCSSVPVDATRRQYLSGVIRNIQSVDTWYRDALMLFASSRVPREPRERSPHHVEEHKETDHYK